MGDDKDGKLVAEAFDGLHDGLLGIVVEGAGGFVEDDDIRLFIECSGYANSLTLTTGEADATFTDIRFIFFMTASLRLILKRTQCCGKL